MSTKKLYGYKIGTFKNRNTFILITRPTIGYQYRKMRHTICFDIAPYKWWISCARFECIHF